MYFNGATLTTLLSDAETAAAYAPVIAEARPCYTSALAVIEAAMELPELGEEELTAFLDAQRIELRDMPPGHHLVAGALATEGDLRDRLHAACAAYYETEVFVLPAVPPAPAAPEAPEAPAVESAPLHAAAPQAE
jgi:hypothetical protein